MFRQLDVCVCVCHFMVKYYRNYLIFFLIKPQLHFQYYNCSANARKTNCITERKCYSRIPAIEVTIILFLYASISIELVMSDEPHMIYVNLTSTFPMIRCKTLKHFHILVKFYYVKSDNRTCNVFVSELQRIIVKREYHASDRKPSIVGKSFYVVLTL